MILEISHVSKKFILRDNRGDKLSGLITSFLQAKKYAFKRDFWALRDISINLQQGKSLGILGRNGSGKSTLLKLINGTMKQTNGTIKLRGKKSALIELGAGFHPDFTGRDNVYLSGLIMGMSKKEVKENFDEIVEFAEVKEFIDVPVKYYSSGMQARLGFAVAIAVKPEILIVDEILSVGDANFKIKCNKRINEMQSDGVSIIFVSHSHSEVKSICQEGIWLDHGLVMSQGNIEDVANDYLDFVNQGGMQ